MMELEVYFININIKESGHYTCFILDQSQRKWVNCNDRTTTLVDFETVYKAATGKINPNMNVSGLVY